MLVTFIIPAREWDTFLQDTLATLANQQLADDVTLEVVVGLASVPPRELPPGVRTIANPSGTIPDALNAAIAASTGEVIVRVDARCHVQPDHVARVLHALESPTVGCVGGAQLVLDRGLLGSAYAIAFNGALLGPTVYRYRRTSGAVDTAYLGAWRRVDLEQLGGFDPRLLRNQDNELADRVRASGKTVFYDADLVVGYHNARNFRGALAHHHEFGLWRMVQRDQGQSALTARHVASLAVLASGTAVAMASVASRRTRSLAVAVVAGAYFAASMGSWRSASRLRQARSDIPGPSFHPASPVLAPALAVILDAAWLAGLARGALRSG